MAAARLAACAELGWRDAQGALHAIAFTPLVIDGAVAAALPFDQAPVARLLEGASVAVLTLSDSRMALRGWTSWAQPVGVDVSVDRDGDWTWTGALDQEVRKYPPSRLLIDTAIQRREHWWYVPRLVLRLRPRGAPTPIARRGGPDDGVLFGDLGDGFTATSVAVDDWDADRVHLTPLEHTVRLGVRPAPALVMTHDFSIPDMERWERYEVTGTRDGGWLRVAQRRGRPTLEPVPGLVRRLRLHWQRERACRHALASYDDASPPRSAT
ncbi:MAG TPA: hypothetical protein VK891_09085 [Euzebyales bacterium]|nr:hypothetical protein [Euzebyales bacterium]